jgi:hypothetical protein
MTALNEVQQFYNYDKPRVNFDTSVLYYFTSYSKESEDTNHTIDKRSRVNDHRILNKNVSDARGQYAENNDAAFVVATTIVYNFDTLPSNIQQVLFKLADNKETAKAVFKAIKEEHSFYRTKQIQENIRMEVAAKLEKGVFLRVGIAIGGFIMIAVRAGLLTVVA